MPLVDIDLKPESKKLRQFGFVSLVAFGVIGFMVLRKGGLFGFDWGAAAGPIAYVLIGLGVLSALFAVVKPQANLGLYLALIIITAPIGFVLSYVLLGIAFYVVITPIGLICRLIGRDALQESWAPQAKTYWTVRDKRRDVKSYFKQY